MAKLGEERLGSFQFSTPVAFEIEDNEVRDRADENVKSAFPTQDGTVWDKVLNTILTSKEIENEIVDNIIDARFVDTATQKQLGLIGEWFGLERQPDEGDTHFRARIKSQLPRNTTGTTIDDILVISANLLGTDPKRIGLAEDFRAEPARFSVHVEDIVFDETTITVDEYETLLQDIKAAGVRATAVIGKQFTHRSVADYDDGINDAERAYDGFETQSIVDNTGEPNTLIDDPQRIGTGGPYADEITRTLT